MSTSHPPRIRKRLLVSDALPPDSTGALDLSSSASFEYTSEDPEHCVENILDDHRGPGGTYWSGARIDSIERLVIAFDAHSAKRETSVPFRDSVSSVNALAPAQRPYRRTISPKIGSVTNHVMTKTSGS